MLFVYSMAACNRTEQYSRKADKTSRPKPFVQKDGGPSWPSTNLTFGDLLWRLPVDSLLVLALFSIYSQVVALSMAYSLTLLLPKPDERPVHISCLFKYINNVVT